MPQSLSNVVLHIIFSTKSREPWLDAEVRPRMHAYLATVCRGLGSDFARAGGMADSLVGTPRCGVRTVNAHSCNRSRSITRGRRSAASLPEVFWQRGYGAFSVSPSQLKPVLKYIDEQQEHHRSRTFQEEYCALLRKHGLNFDERYVWD